MIKGLFVVGLVLLAGCAAPSTMEELEAEAMRSGDWSKVEEREELQARRMGRSLAECPPGYTIFCETEVDVEDCKCVNREVVKSMFNDKVNVQPPNPRSVQ